MEHRTLDRREFTLQSAWPFLSAATITVSGCGGGSSPAPSPVAESEPRPDGCHRDVARQSRALRRHHLRAVHGRQRHSARASAARPITRTPSTLTAAEVTMIGAQQPVSKNSTNDAGHSHTVTFNYIEFSSAESLSQ